MTAKAYALSLLMVLLLPAITTPTLIPKPQPTFYTTANSVYIKRYTKCNSKSKNVDR